MENLKEIIKGYIRENYIKEDDSTTDLPDDKGFNPPDVSQARRALHTLKDDNFIQAVKRIDNLEEAQALLLTFLEFINITAGQKGLLNKNTARQAIDKANFNDFVIPAGVRKDDRGKVVKDEPQEKPDSDDEVEDDSIQKTAEISTSAGAGSYNTKYAFRLKKQKDK